MKKVNNSSKLMEAFFMANEALGFFLDTCSVMFTVIALVILISFSDTEYSWIGLAIAQLTKFTVDMSWQVRNIIYYHQRILSV